MRTSGAMAMVMGVSSSAASSYSLNVWMSCFLASIRHIF